MKYNERLGSNTRPQPKNGNQKTIRKSYKTGITVRASSNLRSETKEVVCRDIEMYCFRDHREDIKSHCLMCSMLGHMSCQPTGCFGRIVKDHHRHDLWH